MCKLSSKENFQIALTGVRSSLISFYGYLINWSSCPSCCCCSASSNSMKPGIQNSRIERWSRCYDDEQVLRTTAGPGAEDQQLFQFSSNGGVSLTSGPVTPIHTTTSGRTFYITDICITVNETAAPQLVQLEISGGIIVFEGFAMSTLPIDMPGIESQPQVPSNSILAIKWPTDSGKLGTYYIAGYEQ